MNPFTTRLILAPCLFAFNWLFYILIFEVLEGPFGLMDEDALMFADCIMASVFAIAWLLIWSPLIDWNALRIIGTLGAFAGASILAFVYFHTMNWAERYIDDFNYVLSYTFWMATWVAATALIWRSTARERAIKQAQTHSGVILCPNCRYNLKGLRETKCPECGSDYTLDQLLAAATEDETPK